MRSRYAAYALGLVDYILHTTDPAGPQHRHDREAWAAEVAAFCAGTRFVGLEVIDASDAGDVGEVSFRATLVRRGCDVSFGERSRFSQVDGRWLYHSGVAL